MRHKSDFAVACLSSAVLGLIFFLAGMADGYATKPPEKVDSIDCSIFDAMPILQEVRPFLDELETPQQIDFKTRLAYVDDWGRRRAVAADKLDHLIEVCRKKLDEQAGD